MEATERDLLIRLDEKMDTVLSWQTEHMTRCHAVHLDHEKRLRGMEAWKYREAGALGVLTFLLGWVREWVFGSR